MNFSFKKSKMPKGEEVKRSFIPRVYYNKHPWGVAIFFFWFNHFIVLYGTKPGWVEVTKPNDRLEPEPIDIDDMTAEEIDKWVVENNNENNNYK